ncbi:MAG: thiol-disulfide isomerase [Acidimicrobiia bacterium]
MKKSLVIVGAVVLACSATLGAEGTSNAAEDAVTFSKDVAPILYESCTECHRPGAIAPMSLLTYQDARPWARAIKQKVASREMPPWFADPTYQEYANDASLSQAEVDTIVAWVDAGAAKGEDADLPAMPEYTEGWSIGEPDMVFSLLEPFDVPADGTIPYLYFTVPTNLTEDKWIRAVEVKPSDRRVVHHVITNLLRPDPNEPPSPKPALPGNRTRRLGGGVGGLVPNRLGHVYPPGYARRIPAGAEIQLQMHYTTIGEPTQDQTSIGVIFTDGNEPPEKVFGGGLLSNSRFVIPPGAPSHEVRASMTFEEETYMARFMPHMHVRGKDVTYTVTYPDGREEILLHIPRYDFNWQLRYDLKEPKLLPAGTKMEVIAHFDNSESNRFNPDPAQEVRYGDQTWEEMMNGFYTTVRDFEPEPTTENQQQ